jgi:signal recognition particle receptor subunit beta
MAQPKALANEILIKIVYYGPDLSGKTANLFALHAMCKDDSQGEFFSVNTQEDRTLFFDLLPIKLEAVSGCSIHFQLFTVPGQPQYDATRRVVLDGADGVVFVADSSESKIQENIDSLTNMHHNLKANMLDIKQIPFVIQYNKRDLPDAMNVGLMNRKLNFRSVPFFESVAITAEGILETFITIAKETVLAAFQKRNPGKSLPDFDSFIESVEANLRTSLSKKPPAVIEPIIDKTTIVRHDKTTVEDLPLNRLMDPADLLTDSLNSSMEAARLYSDMKKANQDNLNLRNYLESLLDSLAAPIVSFDRDGAVLTCNAAAESVFGQPRAEILKRNVAQFVPDDARAKIDAAIQNALNGASVDDFPLAFNSGARSDAAFAPVIDEGGRTLAFSLLLKDASY